MEKIKQPELLPLWSLLILLPSLITAFPMALIAFGFVFLAYRYFQNGFAKRSLLSLSLLAAMVLAIVWISNRTMLSIESGVSLLFGLCCVKINDILNDGDKKIMALLVILLASLAPLLKLDLISLACAFIAVFFAWIYLLPGHLEHKIRYFIKILFLSVPLVLILFLVFPRIVVPWARTAGMGSAGSIGFSDNFNPSQVQELAVAEGTAFTAKIIGPPLPSEKLYWRGTVLGSAQGMTWTEVLRAIGGSIDRSTLSSSTSAPFSYEIFLDHDFNGRAFLLDVPHTIVVDDKPIDLSKNSTAQLPRNQRVTRYEGRSVFGAVLNDEPIPVHLKYTPLGEKVEGIVNQIKVKYSTPQDRMLALNNLFSNLDLEYTLKPGTFKENSVEELLFKKRKGFCGHFASAYAILARALEIPSRVVLGFQGATYNPYGDFYKVDNKDAHAWVELYINGWRRVDPTEFVAPSRISLGAQEFFELPEESRNSKKALSKGTIDNDSALEHVQFWIQDLEFRWTSFILNYDSETQKDLIRTILSPTITLQDGILLVISLLSFLVIRALRRRKNHSSEKEKIFFAIEEVFQRKGLRKSFSEPPLTFMSRCLKYLEEKKYPKTAIEFLGTYASLYEKATYSTRPPALDWQKVDSDWSKVRHLISSQNPKS